MVYLSLEHVSALEDLGLGCLVDLLLGSFLIWRDEQGHNEGHFYG